MLHAWANRENLYGHDKMGMTAGERAVLALMTILLVALVVWVVGLQRERLRALVVSTAAITFALIVLGAFVRLSDAGLGCPDWPGCYGEFTPTLAREAIENAAAQAPHGPVSMPKAWKEMVHRYLAMFVGCLILAAAISTTRQRRIGNGNNPVAHAWLLVGVVVFQAVLGAWTVTWLLKPAIVTLHLLGGMTTLGLLVWLALRLRVQAPHAAYRALRVPAALALAALVVQLALGGWVSTNYAAAACGELPGCQGKLLPPTDFANGFHVLRELGKTAEGANLPLPALTAIHLTHRGFALVVAALFVWLVVRAWSVAPARPLALGLGVALVAQVALGLKVVWSMSSSHLELNLQLPAAAAHNAMAAALLVLTLLISFAAFRRP